MDYILPRKNCGQQLQYLPASRNANQQLGYQVYKVLNKIPKSVLEINKVKGFYLLMTNGNTYSDKQDEFIVEKKFLQLLKDNNIECKELPLNP